MLTPLTDDDPRKIGRYRLQNRIGSGGMGTVYLGFTPNAEPVAIKIAAAELAEDQEFRSRFEREVRAALRVRGGAVATVMDADTTAHQPWMVTEYVEGVSLADAVRRRGRLEDHLVRGLAVGLADALVAIHAAGVVHRDLKPSNILLAWDGPKVIDFGIAQLTGTATLTRTGHVIGTLAWMAPEQMRGESSGAAADIFAWANCVTYAATGRHPFHAESAELLAQRVQRDLPDLDRVPGYLHGLVARALDKAPHLRPDAAALLAGLVGREVRGVTEADEAAGIVLEQTWTGPSPAFGLSPEPAPASDGVGAGRPPSTPPPPASAFRAVSGPGAAGGHRTPARPAGSVPHLASAPDLDAPDLADSPHRGGAGDDESTVRPDDPRPPTAPPDPTGWPLTGRGAGGTPGWRATSNPPSILPAPNLPSVRPGARPVAVPPAAGPAAGPAPHPAWPPGPTPRGPTLGGRQPPSPSAQPYPSPPVRPGPTADAGPGRTAGRAESAARAGWSARVTGPAWNRCAVLSVVLGVLWIFGIGSVAAVGLGHVGRRQIRRRGERGDLLTRIGIGLGWIGVAGALLIGVVIRAVI